MTDTTRFPWIKPELLPIIKDLVIGPLNSYIGDRHIQPYPQDEDDSWDLLAHIIHQRSYSRYIEGTNNVKETWRDTVLRVVVGCYYTLLDKLEVKDKEEVFKGVIRRTPPQNMFDMMYNRYFLPGGRGLWAMGTSLVHDKCMHEALNNCGFVTVDCQNYMESIPFAFRMMMLGVGMGFKYNSKNTHHELCACPVYIPADDNVPNIITYRIEDSSEGWANALAFCLIYCFQRTKKPATFFKFDYSGIRKAGTRLKTFGGISAGAKPLQELLEWLMEYATKLSKENRLFDNVVCADIMNRVGVAVISGNIRRCAEIFLTDADEVADDNSLLELKNYNNPQYAYRSEFGWASNNSIIVDKDVDIKTLEVMTEQTHKTGEPGYVFLDNIRRYGRMCDDGAYSDPKAEGVNPCGEQALESYELCNLVETFVSRIPNIFDYSNMIPYVVLYAKVVSMLTPELYYNCNKVCSRNRRYGISQTGIHDYITSTAPTESLYKKALANYGKLCSQWYNLIRLEDAHLAKLFNMPIAIKCTTVKPSGTLSLLAGGVSPGMHPPIFDYYIRRVRIPDNSALRDHTFMRNIDIEEDKVCPNTMVLAFYKKTLGLPGHNYTKTFQAQLQLLHVLQDKWADNQVSVTLAFDPEQVTPQDLLHVVVRGLFKLKTVSFLPKKKAYEYYPQMPYEEIDSEKYQLLSSQKKFSFNESVMNPFKCDSTPTMFCSNDSCELK